MPVSDVLKGFRNKGYGDDKKEEEKPDSSSPRLIKLTDDEVKELGEYAKGDGQEVTCEVSGRISGNELSVISVKAPGGGEGMDMEMPPPQFPPVMRSQTMPSPS